MPSPSLVIGAKSPFSGVRRALRAVVNAAMSV